MATVRAVVDFHVKPGRYADLFEGLKAVKKIIEQLGASLVVNWQRYGPEAGHIIAVIVYADYAAFAKAMADPQLSGLLAAMRNNSDPAWQGLTVALNEEVAL